MEELGSGCSCTGRNLDRLLRPNVLKILYTGPRHGFAVASALAEDPVCTGAVPDISGVYRCLKDMEKSGLLSSQWKMEPAGSGKPVRVYEITGKGRACLLSWKEALYYYGQSIQLLLHEIEEITRHAGENAKETCGNMEKTKIVLLTGFLGAGKTTFLQRLLEAYGDQKIGVIVNEFGKINIDARLIRHQGLEVAELSNGSMFCACIKDTFVDRLIEMSRKDFTYLFIEASGLSDPSNMVDILESLKEQTGDGYVLAGEICITDAEHFLDLSQLLPALEKQVRYANEILINKCDLVDEARRREIREQVKKLNPEARIHETVNCEIDVRQLVEGMDHPTTKSEETTNTYESRPTTLTLKGKAPLTEEELREFVARVTPSTYRLKGFLQTDKGIRQVDAVGESTVIRPWDREEPSELAAISSVGIKLMSVVLEASREVAGGKIIV